MAYSQTFRRAGFHEAASLSDADPLHWLAIRSASRSAARGRKPTGRAETGGKDARESPCVARAHALPTRGSAWRAIGYVARPPAAPGDDGACACTPLGAHPLLCGWRAHATRRNIALRACPAPSPRLGPILMRVCRPLPPVGKRQARERAARTHGWLAAASPARPACGADCANSQRGPQRRAIAIRPDQRQRLLFQANLLRFRIFGLTRARTPARAIGVKKQKIGK
jgi:hypothetical protein